MALWFVVAAAIGAPLAAAPAQNWISIVAGDPAVGRQIVEHECGSCHSSGYSGLLVSGSRLTQNDIAQRVRDRPALLRALHFERHPTMPKFLFSESQTNNILAYFAELRAGGLQQQLPSPNR